MSPYISLVLLDYSQLSQVIYLLNLKIWSIKRITDTDTNMRHAAFKINIYLTSLVYKNRYFKTEIYPNLLGLPNNC